MNSLQNHCVCKPKGKPGGIRHGAKILRRRADIFAFYVYVLEGSEFAVGFFRHSWPWMVKERVVPFIRRYISDAALHIQTGCPHGLRAVAEGIDDAHTRNGDVLAPVVSSGGHCNFRADSVVIILLRLLRE